MDDLKNAVSLAAWLLRQGEPLRKAINVAAKKHDVPAEDVQRGLSSRSGKSQRGKARPAARRQELTDEEIAQVNQRLDALYQFAEFISDEDAQRLQRIRASLKRGGLSLRQGQQLLHIEAKVMMGPDYDR